MTSKLSEFRAFQKLSPLLYDSLIVHAFDAPSMTVQYLPHVQSNATTDAHFCILGASQTQESKIARSSLNICRVQYPRSKDAREVKDQAFSQHIQHIPAEGGKVEVVQSIAVDSEINRARYMPQNPNLIACRMNIADIHVFNITQFPYKSTVRELPKPTHVLQGHTEDGFGLCWSPFQAGNLLSGGSDKQILLFDINSSNEPVARLAAHDDVVEDVVFSLTDPNVAISVADDGKLAIHDIRACTANTMTVHDSEVTCLAVHPSLSLVVTGASDSTLAMWDLRMMKRKVTSFVGHTDKLLGASWQEDSIFATCADDGKVCIWDASKEENNHLLFMHNGHTCKVSEVCWAPAETGRKWMMGSVSDDGLFQSWQINASLIN